MGQNFVDNYSYLHFAVGIIFNFFNINIIYSLIFHILFEILENTKYGVYVINKYLKIWPGGKSQKDSLTNMVGDTIFFLLGWISADFINKCM